MTFVAQELPTFSIKRFNLQNVLNFNNTRPCPVKNSSMPTGRETLLYRIRRLSLVVRSRAACPTRGPHAAQFKFSLLCK